MKIATFVIIVLLTAMCIGETVVIMRRKAPDPVVAWRLERLQEANAERRQFCASYVHRVVSLADRLANDADDAARESAATELLLLSDSDFLRVCGADDQLGVATMRATAIMCRSNRDFRCLVGFAQHLMFKIPDSPRNYP